MNKRRALFLAVWIIIWLGLPAIRPALIAAVTGGLVAYVVLQVKLVTGEQKNTHKPASMS
ncbi:MAG TPA: hypothetical protein VE136_18165 [Anaerolineales bacterium]|jgi:hypothetical protein|nr:hypothetical protein [Anaerolineales bacterium]